MKKKTLFLVLITVIAALSLSACGVSAKGTGKVDHRNTAITPGSLFVNTNNCADIVSNIDFPVEYSKPGNGVKVMGDVNGASFRYKNVLDISHLDGETNLIEFQNLSMGHGQPFDSVFITLTDKYDAKNKLTIRVKQQIWRAEHSTVATNYDGRWMYIITHDTGHPLYGKIMTDPAESSNGTWISTPFDAGKRDINGNPIRNVNPCNIQFDYKNGRIYSDNNERKPMVMDLFDESQIGYGKQWKAFKTGECYMDISYEGLTGKSGIIISEIAGQKLNGSFVNDATAPKINIDADSDYLTKMPDAQLNAEYKIPDATAPDLVDGYCSVTVGIYQGGVDITESLLIKDGFVTLTGTGNFKLRYTAADSTGNAATKELSVTCRASIPLISLDFETPPEEAFITDRFYIPQIIAEGGSGKLKLTTEIFYNAKPVSLSASRILYLDTLGEIVLVCRVRDYLGTGVATAEEFTIEVKAPEKPVLTVQGVPFSIVKGKTLRLPDFTAKDYQYAPSDERFNAQKFVTVNGRDVTKSLSYIVTENKDETLNVQYKAVSGGKETVKTFAVKVLEPENIWDYVLTEGGNVTVNGPDTEAHIYTQFNSSADSIYTLPQPLATDNLSFVLNTGSDNFEYFDVVLADFFTGDKIFFRFSPGTGDQYVYVQVNGKGTKYSAPGSFSNLKVNFSFKYENATRSLFTTAGIKVCSVSKTFDNFDFEGFKEAAKLSFETKLNGSGVGKFRLHRIANQSFASPLIGAFRDKFAPELSLKGSLLTEAEIGTVFTVPAARAYDVLDSDTSLSVTVTAPDGRLLLDKFSSDKAYAIEVDSYGLYTVSYNAADTLNKNEYVRFNVRISDKIKPVITIKSQIPQSIKFGASISEPIYTVKDNHSSENKCVSKVFVKDVSGYYNDITGKKIFKPAQKGNYTLYVYAYDEAYNVTISTFVIKVV